MVFHKDAIYIVDTYNIKLNEEALTRLEDGIRNGKSQLLTIDASHYGFFNRNGCIYRHDTVQYDIPSFVYPNPKPIIEGHKSKTSEIFGKIVAADYVLTDYYKEIEKDWDIEGLDTEGYLMMCKDALIPKQKQDPAFNGLAFVQVVGKLTHEGAIKKVLDQEFITVSIGAMPQRMICSECLQDQTERMCNHYSNRRNGIFMLAESLGYEELSFVKKPADPFGRIVRIHDGKMEECIYEVDDTPLDAKINIVEVQSFFEGINKSDKKIICIDNICTVINDTQEDEVMNKISVSLLTEFGQEKLASLGIRLVDSEDTVNVISFDLGEEDFKGMKHTQFAVVQRTPEGDKRRLPIHDEAHVRACLQLIGDAEDLSEEELSKANSKLAKAAKKFGIEIKDEVAEVVEETIVAEVQDADADSTKLEENLETIEDEADINRDTDNVPLAKDIIKIVEELKHSLSELKQQMSAEIKDSLTEVPSPATDPITKIFDLLKWFASDVKWAGESLNSQISFFLEDQGKQAIAKGTYDELQEKATEAEAQIVTLTDQVTEVTSERDELQVDIELLDQQNIDLNYKLREQSVNEVVSHKVRLGVIEDSEEAISKEKSKLFKLSINILRDNVSEYRHLSAKLNNTDVNNNMNQLETVEDPTLADELQDPTDVVVDEPQKKKVSPVDVNKALKSLRPNAFTAMFSEKEL
jgi:hypothetical protein